MAVIAIIIIIAVVLYVIDYVHVFTLGMNGLSQSDHCISVWGEALDHVLLIPLQLGGELQLQLH